MKRVVAVLLVLAFLLPVATAHIQGARPILQRSQRERIIGLDAEALALGVDLSLAGDPLRQLVTHDIDPTRGLYRVEHREDASRAEIAFYAQWRFERLIEFRDQNVNGLYEPDSDTAVKAWRFTHYAWQRSVIRQAVVADVPATDVLWEGNLTGGPRLRVEIAIAGRDFSDEGALVRPQDVIVYWDFLEMPPRGLGSLYALEATVTTQASTTLAFHEAENTSTALLADAPLRRALLVWGGEAQLDGAEQRLSAVLVDERVGDDGNRTATLRLNIPTVDNAMRFVLVSALEYGAENKRAPVPWLATLLLGALVAAWTARRGGRR